MDPAFSIHVEEDVGLDNSMLIVGCPGEGLVGATAAKHIISVLKMQRIGSIRGSHHVPPRSIVRDGRSGHPIQIYLTSSLNVRAFRTERLIVIDVERQPDVAEMQALADAIVRWAKASRVRVVVSPGGVTVEDESLNDKVWGVATTKGSLAMLDGLSVERFSGSVGGLAAGLLNACEQQDVDGVCLLAEAAPEYPDAHAAARLIKLLDSMTPAFIIPDTPLIEEAERHEREIRATLEVMEKAGAHTGQKRGGN